MRFNSDPTLCTQIIPPSISLFSRFARSKGFHSSAFSLTVRFGKRIVSCLFRARVTVMYIYGTRAPLVSFMQCMHVLPFLHACAVRVTVSDERSNLRFHNEKARTFYLFHLFTINTILSTSKNSIKTLVIYTSSFALKGYPVNDISSWIRIVAHLFYRFHLLSFNFWSNMSQ